ncbi:MAG TPA: outer membrane beta-barrel protein [Holophaga sp.]|nr:outer membrane beta-barrel protein [Holophaga sp.]
MTKRLSILALALLGATLASAQDKDSLSLTAGLAFAQGNAQDMTGKVGGGFTAEVGYRFRPADFGADLRFYGGWTKLPAATASAERTTYELAGPHVGFDLVYGPWKNISLFTGPSAHVWQVVRQGDGGGKVGDQGLKLGWRLGASYRFAPAWEAGLAYTLTEWRSSPDEGIPPTRPAYLNLTVTYRF